MPAEKRFSLADAKQIDDALITGKIALAHLKEFSDYYTRLSAMEKRLMNIGQMYRALHG